VQEKNRPVKRQQQFLLLLLTIVLATVLSGCQSYETILALSAQQATQEQQPNYYYGAEDTGYVGTFEEYELVAVLGEECYENADSGTMFYIGKINEDNALVTSSQQEQGKQEYLDDSTEDKRKSRNSNPLATSFMNQMIINGYDVDRATLKSGVSGYLVSPSDNSITSNGFMSELSSDRDCYCYFVSDDSIVIGVASDNLDIALGLLEQYSITGDNNV
jgi:hypothetical protein